MRTDALGKPFRKEGMLPRYRASETLRRLSMCSVLIEILASAR